MLGVPILKRDFFIRLLNGVTGRYAEKVEVVPLADYIDSNRKSFSNTQINKFWQRGGWTDFDEKTKWYTIVLNSKVYGYADLVCVLFHELGHVHYKHWQSRNSGKKVKLSDVRTQEIEADKWAHDELVGRADIFGFTQHEMLDYYFGRRIKNFETASMKELTNTGVMKKSILK